MQRDTAVNQLLDQCGQRRSDTTLQQAAIDQFVNEQNEAERGPLLPWFLIQLYENASFVTVAGQNYVATPTGFLREMDDDHADIGCLWYYNAAVSDPWVPVYKEDMSINKRKWGGDDQGYPRRYSVVGGNIYLYPTPANVLSLRLLAYFADTSLTGAYGGAGSTTENLWLTEAPKLLIARAGKVVARAYAKDEASERTFKEAEGEAWATLLTHDTARKEAGIMRAMGV